MIHQICHERFSDLKKYLNDKKKASKWIDLNLESTKLDC